MSAPAGSSRSPVEALDRLYAALDDYHSYVASDPTEPDRAAFEALATVRERLERLTEERDAALAFKEKRCIAHAAVEVQNGDCPICDLELAESEVSRLSSLLESTREGLRRGVAIALVLGQWDGAIADRVGQETWDALFSEGLLRQAAGYPGGEPQPLLTGEGMEFLRALLAVSSPSPGDTEGEQTVTLAEHNAWRESVGMAPLPEGEQT